MLTKFVLLSKTDIDKSTEKFPTPHSKTTEICVCALCNAETQKGFNLKEDDRALCPSRSDYSMQLSLEDWV